MSIWKRWWSTRSTVQLDADAKDFNQLKQAMGLDRRRYARVQVPLLDHRHIPAISVEGRQVEIVNLSMGGVCILDPSNHFGEAVGVPIEVRIGFDQKQEFVPSKLVGVSRHIYRHLQFEALSAELEQRLGLVVRAGIVGTQLRRAPAAQGKNVQLVAEELWTGPGGENLIFHRDPLVFAEINMHGLTMVCSHQGQLRAQQTGSASTLYPAPDVMVADVLVVIENIASPTPLVMQLGRLLTQPDSKKAKGA